MKQHFIKGNIIWCLNDPWVCQAHPVVYAQVELIRPITKSEALKILNDYFSPTPESYVEDVQRLMEDVWVCRNITTNQIEIVNSTMYFFDNVQV